jgi:osmotically-inducible protein OsmY
MWADPSSVTVSVTDGEVVIEGHVETETSAELIRTYALGVPGVLSVETKLTWPTEARERAKDALVG